MADVLQGSTETLVHRGAAFVYKDLPGSQMELGELSQCHSSKPSPAAAAAAGSFLAQTVLSVCMCVWLGGGEWVGVIFCKINSIFSFQTHGLPSCRTLWVSSCYLGGFYCSATERTYLDTIN